MITVNQLGIPDNNGSILTSSRPPKGLNFPVWKGTEWVDCPDAYEHTQSMQISPQEVDSERDRRISKGFEFNGVIFQSRLPTMHHSGDWDVFSGKALEAFIAVSQGAQPNDLRWSDPNSDFSWIAADNSRVPMDAPTVIELCRAASNHRSKHTFAGSDIKAMTPIPVDFADDKWWV